VYVARLVYFLAGFVFIAFSILIFFAEVFNFVDFDMYNVETLVKSGGGALAKSQVHSLFLYSDINFLQTVTLLDPFNLHRNLCIFRNLQYETCWLP